MTQAAEFGARRVVTSAAQDGLWFMDTFVHEAAAYQIRRAYRVTGELRTDALYAAWTALVTRHESLRTTLVAQQGWLSQVVAAERNLVTSFVDLGTDATLADDAQAQRWCEEQAAIPLDLAAGPLARLVVAHVTEHDHLLVLLLHRAIADDESTSILIDELSGAYEAERAGHATRDRLPPTRAQYSDYARWQRRRTASGRFRKLADWWAGTLTPAPPSLTLPVDRARTVEPASADGYQLSFEWGERIARTLADLCTAHRTTPFAALLTAFQALLHRYGGEDRIAVTVPVPVRSRLEFARIVGPCREPVVVCTDITGRPSFRELLSRVTATTDDALRHRGLPFDQLVRAFDPDGDPRVPPLSDAAFVYRGRPEPTLDLAGVDVRELPVATTVVGADITLTVDRVDPVVRGALAVRASMFEQSSVQRMLAQLRTLLAGALADPDLPVDSLPLDEPRAPAVVFGAEHVPYFDLVDRVDAVARAIGDQVAGRAVAVVRVPHGPWQVATLLGLLAADVYVVCVDAGDAGERARAVLADVRPDVLVLDGPPEEHDLVDWYRDELDGHVLDLADLLAPASARLAA